VLAGGALSGSAERHPSGHGHLLVGMATPQQFEAVLAAVQKGQLPPAALERLAAPRQGFAGEPR